MCCENKFLDVYLKLCFMGKFLKKDFDKRLERSLGVISFFCRFESFLILELFLLCFEIVEIFKKKKFNVDCLSDELNFNKNDV